MDSVSTSLPRRPPSLSVSSIRLVRCVTTRVPPTSAGDPRPGRPLPEPGWSLVEPLAELDGGLAETMAELDLWQGGRVVEQRGWLAGTLAEPG